MKSLLIFSALFLLAGSGNAQTPAKPGNVTCSIASTPRTEADKAFAGGRFADAEGLYTQQVSASPSEAAWAGLVHTEIKLDKVTDALAAAKRAIAALPNSATTRALVGDAEYRAGHLDEASAAYTEARKLDPCSAAAHFGAARMLLLTAMNKSAQKELAFAHRLAPTDSVISEALFATLPAAMHAKGLRNLLASDQDMSASSRSRLEQEASVLEAGATCVPVESTGVAKIDFTPLFYDGVHLRDWGIKTTFEGAAPLNLELDSTASGIVLSESDAKKLKVVPAVANAVLAPYVGIVNSLSVGNVRYGKCSVSVVPDSMLYKRYSLIGTDFFRRSLIHIDWNAKQITLTPYPDAATATDASPTDASMPEAEKDWSHVFVDDQRILMPSLVDKKPAGLLMLDTSYMLQMLSASAAQPFHPTADNTLEIAGVSGDFVRIFQREGGADIRSTQVVDAKGGNLKIQLVGSQEAVRFAGNEPPIFGLWSFDITPTSHSAGLEVGGIIGFRVLQQYYIDLDYRNALIQLKYDYQFPLRQAALISR